MEFGLHRFHGGKWIACLVFTSHSATEPRDLRKRKNDKVSRVGYVRVLVEGKGADRAGGHRHSTRHDTSSSSRLPAAALYTLWR